ncbi:MAG: DUF1624 domain-containing protein [Sphingobacteriales bacterium]
MTIAASLATSKTTALAEPKTKYRIESIDILRGLVMLIMAIDHIRDFFNFHHPDPTNLAITTPFLFFTRWITHFCAPVFVFLSGMSAYLAGTRRTKKQFSTFLIKRGLWLLVVEVVFITFAITLDPFYHLFILQVIWAIGGSMVLLGLLVWLPTPVVAAIGAVIVLGHNYFDLHPTHLVNGTVEGKMLVSGAGFGGFVKLSETRGMLTAYALLPWAGLMMIGYSLGSLYNKTYDAVKRRKILLYSGLSVLALFFILRFINGYGDPAPWSVQKTTALSIISFFNVTKYPPSLMYMCMTIGAALVILATTEKISNKFASVLIVYGNVPFFYYLCHWYLIKLINIVVYFASGYTTSQISTSHQFPPTFQPDDFGFGLGGVYLIWLIVIAALYLPCRWYSKYKRTHTQWWLSYL